MLKNLVPSAAFLLLLLSRQVSPGAMDFTFDMSALGNPDLDAGNVYVTFAAASSDLVYGSGLSQELINFSNGAINIGGTNYGTSRAYSLQEIATHGLVLNSATSLIGYISYGSSTGISMLGSGVQPGLQDTSVPRFSNFEISYNGSSGGADLTNISQFGGSLRMEFLSGGSTQSYVQNTLNTGDTFRALAATSGNSPSAVITSGGQFVRAVGPNTFPTSIAGNPVESPYPKLNNYLESLHTAYGTGSVVTDLTNLAPGSPHGGPGAVGATSTSGADPLRVDPSTSYNLDYHFQAFVTRVTAPSGPSDPNGTYSVQLTGSVYATNSSNPADTYEYTGLTIAISADDLANGNFYMTNFLYTESTTGQGIEVAFGGWDDLDTDFGSGFVSAGLQLKAANDFAQGILNGFVGSDTLSPDGALKDLTSYQWWQNPTLAYAPAQPDNPFYSAWGNVVSENSGGLNGVSFDRGGVYGSPYDDRFSLNLISPDSSTDEVKITLLADGSLAVPEPGAYALVGTGLLFILALRHRRNPRSL